MSDAPLVRLIERIHKAIRQRVAFSLTTATYSYSSVHTNTYDKRGLAAGATFLVADLGNKSLQKRGKNRQKQTGPLLV